MIRLPVVAPCLLVLFRFVSLYASNVDVVAVDDLLVPFALSLAVVAAATLALSQLSGHGQRASLAVCAWTVAFFFFAPLRAWLETLAWLSEGDVAAVLAGLLLVGPAGLVTLLALRAEADLARVTGIVSFAVLVGMSIPVTQILLHAWSPRAPFAHPALAEFAPPPESEALERPDIYYIVLDGYGRHDVLRHYYGIDSDAFLRSLSSSGFYVAESSRSNYGQTTLSLASSLNFTYLDDLSETPGEDSDDKTALVQMVRMSAAVDFLKRRGYRFVSFATGYAETELRSADVYLKPRDMRSEADQLLADQLPGLGAAVGGSLFEAHRQRILYALDGVAELSEIPSPKFVFAHVVAPHPPFVFDADGGPVAHPKRFAFYDGSAFMHFESHERYLRGYAQQLMFVSSRLQPAIRKILDHSPDAIVIIQGDHGPGSGYHQTEAEKTDFGERFSILNALYLPGGGHRKLYPEVSPVNTFRIVFNHYFGANFELLPDRSYYSSYFQPYRYLDVTEQAASWNSARP